MQVRPEVLAAAYETHAIECDGEPVPMYFLGSLLELPNVRPLAQRQSPVVVVRAGTSRIALHVDRVVPNQEVVIKNVGPQLARVTPSLAAAEKLPGAKALLNKLDQSRANLNKRSPAEVQKTLQDASRKLTPVQFEGMVKALNEATTPAQVEAALAKAGP